MSKGGSVVLEVFTLLIALGALGLGAYSVFILPNTIEQQATTLSEISQVWTVQQDSSYFTPPGYTKIPDMNVTITVIAGENVYFLFNAYYSASIGVLQGGVRIMMDNVEIPESQRVFNIESSNGASIHFSLTSQVIVEGLSAGQYEIEVQVFGWSSGDNERILSASLLVYTYV